jgi:acyl-CoA synthetase (AMP-forming)/AMP-acid ligase II
MELENIIHRLCIIEKEFGNNTAIIQPAGDNHNICSLNYSTLFQYAASYRELLSGMGVSKCKVLILCPLSIELTASRLALMSLGATACMFDPAIGMDLSARIIKEIDPEFVIGSAKTKYLFDTNRTLFSSQTQFFNIDEHPLSSLKLNQDSVVANTDECSELASIVYTSGTTGYPKAVEISQENLIAQKNILTELTGFDTHGIEYLTLSYLLMSCLLSGRSAYIPELNFSSPGNVDAAAFINSLEQSRATQCFASPVVWEHVCKYALGNNLTFQTLKHIAMGGASVKPALLSDLRYVFPDATIRLVYGATEALAISSIDADDYISCYEKTLLGKGICLGAVSSQLNLMILNKESLTNQADSVGEILVRGPNVSTRYHFSDKNTGKYQSGDGQKWHKTGDIGYFDTSNRLWYLSRQKNCFRHQGTTLYLESLEFMFDCMDEIKKIYIIDAHGLVLVVLHEKDIFDISNSSKEIIQKIIFENDLPITHYLTVGKISVDARHNIKADRNALAMHIEKHRDSLRKII